MKTLLIRADAGSRIGTGHVIRCLALADAWQPQYGRAILVSYCESDALARRAADSGVEFIPVAAVHPNSLDLQDTLHHVRELRADGIVLDGYHFDLAYQRAIKASGSPLMVIDDFAHWPQYEADVLVNQNINAEQLPYSCNSGAQLLLGTPYALLRSQFSPWAGYERQTPPLARKILVTLGGADPDNVTLKVVRALQQNGQEALEATIVLGASNPHEAEIRFAVQAGRPQIRLVNNATDMPELMAWADIAISAAGITCWELALMGLPSIILVQAENQLRIAQGLDRAGIAINLGWHHEVSERAISEALTALLKQRNLRRQMSEAGQKLVDGGGASRVAEAFHNKILEIKSCASLS